MGRKYPVRLGIGLPLRTHYDFCSDNPRLDVMNGPRDAAAHDVAARISTQHQYMIEYMAWDAR